MNVVSAADVKLQLEKCPICTRSFVPESLEKHIGICEKMNTRKRKIFDSSKQRIDGTDLASYKPLPLPSSTGTLKVVHTEPQPIKISPPKTVSWLDHNFFPRSLSFIAYCVWPCEWSDLCEILHCCIQYMAYQLVWYCFFLHFSWCNMTLMTLHEFRVRGCSLHIFFLMWQKANFSAC